MCLVQFSQVFHISPLRLGKMGNRRRPQYSTTHYSSSLDRSCFVLLSWQHCTCNKNVVDLRLSTANILILPKHVKRVDQQYVFTIFYDNHLLKFKSTSIWYIYVSGKVGVGGSVMPCKPVVLLYGYPGF